jgi:hypothetical protein
MNHLKMLSCAALSAMALMAFAGGSASATTLEVGGVVQNKSVALEITMSAGTSAAIRTTDMTMVDTCTFSRLKGSTEGSFSGTTVGGKAASWETGNCTHSVKMTKPGSITIQHTAGTNGTVRSSGAEIQVQSTTFGTTLVCSTNNTHLGTLSGVSSGHAKIKTLAVVNCGFFVPSAMWESEYTVTSPTGFGVVA